MNNKILLFIVYTERMMRVFENMVLRRVLGVRRDEVNRGMGKII